MSFKKEPEQQQNPVLVYIVHTASKLRVHRSLAWSLSQCTTSLVLFLEPWKHVYCAQIGVTSLPKLDSPVYRDGVETKHHYKVTPV